MIEIRLHYMAGRRKYDIKPEAASKSLLEVIPRFFKNGTSKLPKGFIPVV